MADLMHDSFEQAQRLTVLPHTTNILINGVFDGNIESAGCVTVAEHGIVLGDIHAEEVVIGGEVRGTVVANRIEIQPSGRLAGAFASGSRTADLTPRIETVGEISNV